MIRTRLTRARLSAAVSALVTGAAQAQSGVHMVPSLGVSETLTSNRDLSSTNPQADAITQISPGISMSLQNSRVRASLIYNLNAVHYLRSSASDRIYNVLDGSLATNSEDGRATLDARANISQQMVSPFATRSSDPQLNNSNSTEVMTVSVAPAYRLPLGDWATLSLQGDAATTRSSAGGLGDSSTYGGMASLGGRGAVFGWSFAFGRQTTDFKASRTTTVDTASLSLTATPRYDLMLGVQVGRQGADVFSSQRTWVQTTGWNVQWQPTDRTNIAIQNGRTYYGRSHSYSLNHRMQRSVWSYSDVQGTNASTNNMLPVAYTLYDLLLANCVRNGGTAAGCDTDVRNAIANSGLSGSTVLGVGYLQAGLARTRTQLLSFSLSGQRDTVTLTAQRSETSALDPTSPFASDVPIDAVVHQQGFTFGLSHRLTPTSNAALTLSSSRTSSTSTQGGNSLLGATASWLFQPGERMSASLSARATRFKNDTHPYDEYALIGSLGLRF